ncbi:regulation of nuclear pre-mRNA domain-containing protein 2 [Vitis riparia]|uniref:regulation of nuclear pre-mRNA domain-containing protein 2 n=1 Tax=Vitis riparia TaxID=96939 RepID=UPI00155A2ABD|nr:regulation of nuclear pre-mRNA domain-containing protein 2 [Vitis riparia]XP_034707648.1 regulation of nuclear pre-mRNA domain-containing protein 2 [Vitis riparia]XP_034707649.1 regulation of nuclear pre-mRNA domain-containing protein 2 [Vitis riparia]
MGSTFNPLILIEKLSKLNSSQQSIETLSHWCIFHMNKAKQVVETWDRQFHCSPSEQRLAFLYLANDILQNSRRKGSEFVGEFWKVLPDALRDVMENGDEFGRTAVLRLIGIWEERKVFGSRGQILKEEFGGRQLENSNRNGKHLGFKLKQSAGNTLEKIVSGYQVIYGGQLDEDVILRKCTNAISYVEKADKGIDGGINSAQQNGSGFVEELQGQHTILRDCIEQLTLVESSRASLVSNLREALQEQEFKLDQVRNQLQAAQFQAEQAGNMCRRLLKCNNNTQLLAEQSLKETRTTEALLSFVPGTVEQSAPVMFTRQVSFPEKPGHIEEDPRKSAAAAVAAKLTASTSSAQMLTFVLSSLASEGVIGNPTKESSGDYPAEKRTKLENDQSAYTPQNPQPSVSAFPNLDQLQHNVSTTTQQSTPSEQPPPPSSPPPLPPMPPMPPYQVPQYMQAAGSMTNIPYSYGMTQQGPPSAANYPTVGPPVSSISSFTTPPANSYQSFQGSEGGFYGQPSSLPMAPISRR